MTTQLSAKFTLWCNRLIAGCLAGLILFLPALLQWYIAYRPLATSSQTAILAGFYCCTPVVAYALWCIDRLVSNILAREIFVIQNVRYLRRIRWCCAGVSLVCLIPAVFYPPLVFMVVIMAFLALIVSVVKNVMAAAVEIREENDLTV